MANGKNFSSLPPWAKGTIAIVLTVGAVVGVVFTVKAIKSRIDLAAGGTDVKQTKEVDAVTAELEKLNKDPKTRQKLSTSQALSVANTIDQAMQGLGTDEQAVKDQFYKMNNDADFLAVQKAWGKRLVRSGSVVFVDDIKLTFISALRNELDEYWISLINGVLKTKKIKYRV